MVISAVNVRTVRNCPTGHANVRFMEKQMGMRLTGNPTGLRVRLITRFLTENQ